MRTLVLTNLAALLFCTSLAAHAQTQAVREEAIASVVKLAPECAAYDDPGSKSSLEEQKNFWDSLQACLTRSTARLRISGASGAAADPLAVLQAQELQKQLVGFSAEAENQKDFLGWSWGVGFGVGIADEKRIEAATIINNVVHSTKDTSSEARLFLEYHWYPETWQSKLGARDAADRIVRAQGPFVAVSSRDDKILSGVGLGWSVGFRDEGKSEGFGISVGAMLDNDVTTLADGFEDGKPPPDGETAIRTESKSRLSWVLFVTRTF